MSFKIFSHKLTARKQKKHFTRFCSKLFKVSTTSVTLPEKKTCQTRFRVLKPKGVGAPPTFPIFHFLTEFEMSSQNVLSGLDNGGYGSPEHLLTNENS